MFTAALIFITLICFLLILVVLIQNSKGGGLASGVGSGSANLIGVKKTGDLLENVTWGLAITLLVGCLATNFIIDRDGDGNKEEINSVNVERAQESGFAPQQQPAAAPAPEESK